MTDLAAATLNLGAKVVRRLGTLHKPLVRQARRASRAYDHAAGIGRELRVTRDLANVASGRDPIVIGPWLSEVGYEILYWIPFLRWFADRYRLDPDRLLVLSRGGVAAWYADITPHYAEILGIMRPEEFAARNEARRSGDEAGGQKQLGFGALDEELVAHVRERFGVARARVCHPSLMYRLFRQFWFGNRALDVVTRHTRVAPARAAHLVDLAALPRRYTAVKFYTGAAIPDVPLHRALLREMVVRLARQGPVVLLDSAVTLDEHADYPFSDIPNVVGIRPLMTPENNLGVQTQVIAGASAYVGTCGGLAWLAPLLGIPTVAVYAEERFLVSHLYVARQAYRQVGAAAFLPLDLHGALQLGALEASLAPLAR